MFVRFRSFIQFGKLHIDAETAVASCSHQGVRFSATMRVLGLNCAASTIYLVTLEDGKILADDPLRLGMPDVEAASTQLRSFVSTFGSALIDLAVERIGLVLPESTYQATYKQLADRAAAETLIRLAALEQQVRFERLTR